MSDGLAIGHAMAELAAEKAGKAWQAAAFYAFKRHAMKHQFFTTEEVRAANPDIPAPPDDRAWGEGEMQIPSPLGSRWGGSRSANGFGGTEQDTRAGHICKACCCVVMTPPVISSALLLR